MASQRVHLIRHGQTEWSLSGKHTGVTDIPMTEEGRRAAALWQPVLSQERFALVLTSPMRRTRETCELTGLASQAQLEPDLVEWNYGDYEGKTPAEIHATNPDWMIFKDGGPHGESPEQVEMRLDRVIGKVRSADGPVVIFSHGHLLRSFAARWMGFHAADGCHFLLDTATLCVMSYYEGIPAITHWNVPIAQST